VRLIRKLADQLDGVNVSHKRVGECSTSGRNRHGR